VPEAAAIDIPRANDADTAGDPDIGPVLYIAATLPKLSETFVYREFFALRERGVCVLAASVHPPERRLGDARLDALAAEAIPVYWLGSRWLWAHALAEFARHPARAARTMALGLRDAILGQDLTPARRPRVIYQAFAGLAHRVRPRRIAHIHAHMAHVPASIAMYAARQLRVPFSFTGHANDLFPSRALLKEKLRRAAFAACISQWHRELYRSIQSLPDERLPIVRCGVDIPRQPAAESHAGVRILTVGRLIPKKGFDVLVDAVASLLRSDPNLGLSCRIVGEGPERTGLEQQIRILGLQDHIDLAGPMPNADVLAALSDADLFVLPCRVEPGGDRDGIPVVLMEAMARGVCVVSGDLPAIRELILHARTGLLAPPGDATALAAAMETLIRDRALRAKLAGQGRERVAQEFSSGMNAARIMAAFRAAAKDPRPCAV
jgi:colanic acid/amylovoran biosynthesis glycosyltransferase